MEVERAETEAAAIRVTTPIYGSAAINAIQESRGIAVMVTDRDMLESEKEIARFEGLFVEPASAATVACLRNLVDSGGIDKGDSVVRPNCARRE